MLSLTNISFGKAFNRPISIYLPRSPIHILGYLNLTLLQIIP